MQLPQQIQAIIDDLRLRGREGEADAVIEFWDRDSGAYGVADEIERDLNNRLAAMACGCIRMLDVAGMHEAATHLFAITQSAGNNGDVLKAIVKHIRKLI